MSGESGPDCRSRSPFLFAAATARARNFLEFATALNVSAGGMLVAIRRVLPAVAQIRLEIPSAPVAALAPLPRAARTLRAKALRTTPAEGYYLLGLKFSRPLMPSGKATNSRRKDRWTVKMFAHSLEQCYSGILNPDCQGGHRLLFGKLRSLKHIL